MTEQEIKAQVQREVDPFTKCVSDIRRRLSEGLDTISDDEIMDWLLCLGVMLCEIAPRREDSGLSKTLYEIAHKSAENIKDFQRAEELKTFKAFSAYRRSYIDTTVSMVEKLAVTLRRVLDYRIAHPTEV